ncbi:TPR-like protein [Calocera viscosa TUFC12733]|uniref:TPR-like protein n=1 Tax=Calocera viscosa (strain TUFC12733) TaxID=1330018 RepID=A0A167R266_CALVF|nr:TPR-like protein [Calocera viscosa TUFC12733]
MGRTKTKTRSTRLMSSSAPEAPPHASISPKGAGKRAKKPAPTIEALIAKAQELVVQCDYDLARQFVDRVLEREGGNVEARELKGVVEMESGDVDIAKEIFLSLVPPSSTAPVPAPPSAHLYLAQLYSDDDARAALQHYQTAVSALLAKMGSKGKEEVDKTSDMLEEEEGEMKKMVVRACCSMVDIWMTDLCFEPEAEASCEEILRQALGTDPDNTEALLSLASVRMSQQRPDDAEQCVRKVWSMWEEIAADSPSHPTPPTLLSFARLCLELELFDLALSSISRTLEMDDTEVEAWYLEGWCFWLMSQGDEVRKPWEDMTKEDMLRDARDCLDTCLMLHTNQQHPDEQLLQHVQELLRELEALGVHATPPDEEATLGNAEEDDEWVDDDEELDDEDEDVEMS